jgi:hypothetical protein
VSLKGSIAALSEETDKLKESTDRAREAYEALGRMSSGGGSSGGSTPWEGVGAGGRPRVKRRFITGAGGPDGGIIDTGGSLLGPGPQGGFGETSTRDGAPISDGPESMVPRPTLIEQERPTTLLGGPERPTTLLNPADMPGKAAAAADAQIEQPVILRQLVVEVQGLRQDLRSGGSAGQQLRSMGL